MATAAAPSFHSSKETTNYARLCRLLVDVGSDVLREAFEKKRPTGNLDTVLSSPPVHTVLQSLKKKVLNPLQWGKLYPAVRWIKGSNERKKWEKAKILDEVETTGRILSTKCTKASGVNTHSALPIELTSQLGAGSWSWSWAQLVERCTGIAEVMGSNPVRAWNFFRSYLQLIVSVVFLAAKIS